MTDEPFVSHRDLLFTVAYEMLGFASTAISLPVLKGA